MVSFDCLRLSYITFDFNKFSCEFMTFMNLNEYLSIVIAIFLNWFH